MLAGRDLPAHLDGDGLARIGSPGSWGGRDIPGAGLLGVGGGISARIGQ
jgi:hypothetical protein